MNNTTARSDPLTIATQTLLSRRVIPALEDMFDTLKPVLAGKRYFAVFFRQPKQPYLPRTAKDTTSTYILFNHISFAWSGSRIVRFTDRFDVLAAFKRNQRMRTTTMQRVYFENTVFFFSRDFDAATLSRVITLLTAYYVSSDVYDHYIQRTSKRLLRTIGPLPYWIADSLQSIHDLFSTHVLYYAVDRTNDIALDSNSTEVTLKLQHQSSPPLANAVETDVRQKSEAALSVLTEFSGRIDGKRRHYYKLLPVYESSYTNAPARQTAQGSKGRISKLWEQSFPTKIGVLALVSQRPIDVICHSLCQELVKEVAGPRSSATRLAAITALLTERSAAENEVALNPLNGADSYFHLLRAFAGRLATLIVRVTAAHSCTVRLLNPFRNVLFPIAAEFAADLPDESAKAVDIPVGRGARDNSLNEYTLRHCGDGECVYVPRIRYGVKPKDLPFLRTRRESQSAVCLPVFDRGIPIGTINIESRLDQAFDRDLDFCIQVAQIFAGMVSGITRASDAAWLPRLSFIHFAAHRIEKFKRPDIAGSIPGLRSTLEQLEKHLSPDYVEPAAAKRISLTEVLNGVGRFIQRYKLGVSISSVVSVRGSVPTSISAMTAHSLEVILENLIENLCQHSSTKDQIVLLFGSNWRASEAWRRRPFVTISYVAKKGRRFLTDIDHAGFAPVWSERDSTYHIGMYLIGVHARLLGGHMWVDNFPNIDARIRQFRLFIQIPLWID